MAANAFKKGDLIKVIKRDFDPDLGIEFWPGEAYHVHSVHIEPDGTVLLFLEESDGVLDANCAINVQKG